MSGVTEKKFIIEDSQGEYCICFNNDYFYFPIHYFDLTYDENYFISIGFEKFDDFFKRFVDTFVKQSFYKNTKNKNIALSLRYFNSKRSYFHVNIAEYDVCFEITQDFETFYDFVEVENFKFDFHERVVCLFYEIYLFYLFYDAFLEYDYLLLTLNSNQSQEYKINKIQNYIGFITSNIILNYMEAAIKEVCEYFGWRLNVFN